MINGKTSTKLIKLGKNLWKRKKLILNCTSEYNRQMSNYYNNYTYKMNNFGKCGLKIFLKLTMKKIPC